MTQGDFGAVSAQLRAGAEGLSPGASGMAAWLREQAAALEQTSAVLGKALADHRALPTDADPEVLRVLTVVRRYRVAVAGDAVLDVANELEEMARSLLADGDSGTARALCLVADRIDEGLRKAYADHPGWDLLPSKLDPRVKRWQRVTTVNASDEKGGGAQKTRRVAMVEDWGRRNRPGLQELDEGLDRHVRRALPGVALKVQHDHGAGIYQNNSEPTSRTVYEDADGKVFSGALPACAVVGLAKVQNEVFLSHIFPEQEPKEEAIQGKAREQAHEFAEKQGLEFTDPVATFSVYYSESPETILSEIDRLARHHGMPPLTTILTDDGLCEVNFLLLPDVDQVAVRNLLLALERKHPLVEAGFGWCVARSSGDEAGGAIAAEKHRACLEKARYSSKEIDAIERGEL